MDYAEYFNLEGITTPINVGVLDQMLREAGYDSNKTDYLVEGFSRGFSIEYQGPTNRRDEAPNHRLRCGSKVDLWNKLIKEVHLKRVSGPWGQVPDKF